MRPNLSWRWLAVVLLLALAVRAWDVGGQSLNMDEVYEVTHAPNDVATIVRAADSMPPAYPLVLKAWLAVWQTDAAARWLSVLLGVATVACVYGIGRELVDEATGLAAALLAAVLPLGVYYSQFVRAYALMCLLVAVALWLLLRAAKHDRPSDWGGFAVASIAGMYTHYYFVVFLTVSLVVVVVERRRVWIGRRALMTFAAIAVCCLPLLWLLPGDLTFQTHLRNPTRLTPATFGYTLYSFFSGESLGPSPRELHTMSARDALTAAAPWIVAIAAAVGVLGLEGWRRMRGGPAVSVLLTMLLLPMVIVGALGYVGGLNYHLRFVLWSAIAVVVWLGAGLAIGWSKWYVRGAAGLLVAVFVCAVYQRHAVARYQNEDLRAAANYIAAHAEDGDTVFVLSDYLADGVRYYLRDDRLVVELPSPGDVNRVVRTPSDVAAAIEAVETHAPEDTSFWLVYSRGFHGDPEALLLEELAQRFDPQLEAEPAGVAVYRGQR